MNSMKYGVPIYRQCAHCQHAIEIHPLVDGSHSGSVLWSDGFIESLMMPEQAILAKCGNCAEVVWFTDLEPVNNPEPEQITGYNDLTTDDYLALLETPLSLDTERTIIFRALAWQKSNHSRRGKEMVKAYSEAEQKNMRELDALLGDEWENELIMKIEIARELGDFEKAAKLMEDIDFSIQVTHLTNQLRKLVEEKDPKVKAFQTQGLGDIDHIPK